MTLKNIAIGIGIAAMAAGQAFAAEDVVRLGSLKFAHCGAISYIKEIAPKCGIKVEERVFAKGPDVIQTILAGEIDVGATAFEGAIYARANGAPIYIVAGFAEGGARLVARPDAGIRSVKDLKAMRQRVAISRARIGLTDYVDG